MTDAQSQSQGSDGNGQGESPGESRHRRPPRRRQASTVELAAILMETVCGPTSAEQEAIEELAQYLGLELGRLQTELLFLRAFAVEFGTTMTLGDSEETRSILSRYYQHWERVGAGAGDDVLADLHERLQYYAEIVGSPSGTGGLGGQVGAAFASLCQDSGEGVEDLAMLGASMFAALFEEVCELFTGIDIVVFDEAES
ncbi:hypothetical protein ACFL6X_07450 [Candidatus Latescibacterota bacterium]